MIQEPVVESTHTGTDQLNALSRRARRLVLETVAHAGAGHVGGPLSVTDILVNLYFNQLRIDPDLPGDPTRDRCILNKGYSSIALYVALGARLSSLDFRTLVILGDGEIQKGQIWEAAFVAARYGLANLTAIVDYNRLPQFGWPDPSGYTRTEPIDDPGAKLAAFGWNTIEVDGHDHDALNGAFDDARSVADRPTVVIAHTVKGKGISFMERDHNWHATVPDPDQLATALSELDPEQMQ